MITFPSARSSWAGKFKIVALPAHLIFIFEWRWTDRAHILLKRLAKGKGLTTSATLAMCANKQRSYSYVWVKISFPCSLAGCGIERVIAFRLLIQTCHAWRKYEHGICKSLAQILFRCEEVLWVTWVGWLIASKNIWDLLKAHVATNSYILDYK